jgi:hypothetical protein
MLAISVRLLAEHQHRVNPLIRRTEVVRHSLSSQSYRPRSSGNKHVAALWACPTSHRRLLHIYVILRAVGECSLE